VAAAGFDFSRSIAGSPTPRSVSGATTGQAGIFQDGEISPTRNANSADIIADVDAFVRSTSHIATAQHKIDVLLHWN
jgi:hypothetical protein